MPELVAYCAADVHVPEAYRGGAWKDLSGVWGDALAALDQVGERCTQADVPLLLAGDVFDGPDIEPKQLAALYEVLPDKVYYVLGNHERGRDWLAPYGSRSAVNVTDRVVTLKCGLSLTGLDFTDPTLFADRVRSVRPTDVGLYHQGFSEWLPGAGRPSVTCLPPHRLAVCGDVHVAGLLAPAAGPAAALSPGALVPQSVAELGPSYVWALYSDTTVERVPLRVRKSLRTDVASAADAEAVLLAVAQLGPDPELAEHLASPLVAVRMTHADEDFVAAVTKLAADRGVVLRLYEPAAGRPDEAAAPPRPRFVTSGVRALSDAIAAWDAPAAVRTAAGELVADGADPAEWLRKARAAAEVKSPCPVG